MKKSAYLFLILIFSALFTGAKSPAQTFPWYAGMEGYKASVQEQKSSKQPVILYFYTTWCPYCRSFEKEVLHTPRVEKALSGTVKVKIDVDFERELAEKFGIESFPRVVVVSPSGKWREIPAHRSIAPFLEEARKAGIKIRKD